MKEIKTILIIVSTILLFSVKSNAQIVDKIIDNNQITKMIQNSLFIVLKVEKMYIEKKFTSKKLEDVFYIWTDYYPAGFEITQEIIDLKLKLDYISENCLTQEQKEKGISGIAFQGVKIIGNKIILYFMDKSAHLRNNVLNIGIDGEGYSFEYTYSCNTNEWVLTKMPEQYYKL